MRSKVLSFLIVFCLTLALSTPVEVAQGAGIRIRVSISIKIMIKITVKGTYSFSSSIPSEYRLIPQNVEAVRGEDGSSVDISWSAPLNGAPSKGYEVELALKDRRLLPSTSGTWLLHKHKVTSDVNVLQINDLEPSRIYEVMVRSIDDYGEHSGEPTRFCSPSYSKTDLGCIFDISASKGTYITVPESRFDPTSTIWNLPDNGPKTGSINVSWSPAKNARSYVVQWDGLQSPRDFGEKTVPSSQNSYLITGLPGSHQYSIRVLAIGLDGLYSESFTTRAYASPSSSTGPILSGGKGEASVLSSPSGGWVTKEYITIGINPQADSNGQSDYLKTEAFLIRFRKKGETLWKNADVVLNELPRMYFGIPVGYYPNNKEVREYFLPDLVSDFEFQVAEVSATPSGGRVVGDWSISLWFGPNRTALNRSELDKRTPLGDSTGNAEIDCYRKSTPEQLKCLRIIDAFMVKGTSALERFEADTVYRDSIKSLQLMASQAAAAELKAKQEAEAKAAAEVRVKQEAEAKAAAQKKTTITCVKGKLSRKVTAVKPKCPTGYKLKK